MTPEQNAHVKTLVDKKEIFDYVVNHLRQQGTRALNMDLGDCAYRGDDNTMCAVGCLLADDEYDPCFEGSSADELELELPHRLRGHMNMLQSLQLFHDADDYWDPEETGFSLQGEQQLEALRGTFGIK
jgi:hypothetical protein